MNVGSKVSLLQRSLAVERASVINHLHYIIGSHLSSLSCKASVNQWTGLLWSTENISRISLSSQITTKLSLGALSVREDFFSQRKYKTKCCSELWVSIIYSALYNTIILVHYSSDDIRQESLTFSVLISTSSLQDKTERSPGAGEDLDISHPDFPSQQQPRILCNINIQKSF